MNQNTNIEVFSKLGDLFTLWGENKEWPGHQCGLTETEFSDMNELIKIAYIYNGWFTEVNVRLSLLSLGSTLNKKELSEWLSGYSINHEPKVVALILAGNIPFVGFHDILCVICSGNKALIKPSSDDAHLTKGLVHILGLLNAEMKENLMIEENRLENFDAVIATGSNNSARYFEQYFGKHPNIIRKSRTSVAVIEGNESEDEFALLANDVFDYFGLGCRNVSKLFVPEDFDLNNVFKGFFEKNQLINHNKYANNYDYHKAIFLMNQDDLIENGFIMLKEDESMFSPLATLFYERYTDIQHVKSKIEKNKEEIQIVIGKEYVPFGQSQQPSLSDYADDIDTMKFLTEL